MVVVVAGSSAPLMSLPESDSVVVVVAVSVHVNVPRASVSKAVVPSCGAIPGVVMRSRAGLETC